MKKQLFLILILCMVLMHCSKQETVPGEVGNPLYLVPMVSAPEDTMGCAYQWTFLSMPDNSNLNVLSFQPTSRSFNIFYVPDAEGDYLVSCSVLGPDGKVKSESECLCQVVPGTGMAAAEPAAAAATKESGKEVPEHLPGPVYEEKTTQQAETVKPKPVKEAPKTPVKPVVGKEIPKVEGKYTIQLSSWKDFDKAENAMTKLSNLGIDVYIQRAFFKETNETWYRVRSGSFDSYTEAKKEMDRLKQKFPKENIWIDHIRKD